MKDQRCLRQEEYICNKEGVVSTRRDAKVCKFFPTFICFCCALGAVITFIFARNIMRSEELEPLLDAIAASHVCYHEETATCAVELDPTAQTRFDLHEAENPLFGFLYAQLARRQRSKMREILSGAHVRLADSRGEVYSFFRRLPGARMRISSHDSDSAQYGIPEGRAVSSVLVGTLHNQTWFQLEASPWDPFHNIMGSLFHCVDFLEYRVRRRNIGPLGTSASTDKHPLVDGPLAPPADACPEACPQSPRMAALQVRRLLGAGQQAPPEQPLPPVMETPPALFRGRPWRPRLGSGIIAP